MSHEHGSDIRDYNSFWAFRKISEATAEEFLRNSVFIKPEWLRSEGPQSPLMANNSWFIFDGSRRLNMIMAVYRHDESYYLYVADMQNFGVERYRKYETTDKDKRPWLFLDELVVNEKAETGRKEPRT